MAGLVYPVFALPTKTNNFTRTENQTPPTLDGLAYLENFNPGDYAAIEWIIQNTNPDDIILEAVGNAYSYHARISAATGRPTVIGWANHERQWRGDLYNDLAGNRENDVREIYNSLSMSRALELLEYYDVEYVYVGSLETDVSFAAPAGIQKFERYLTAVYSANRVTIYRVGQPLSEVQE